MKQTKTYIYFLKNYLSNYYYAPVFDPASRLIFYTNEHYFMWSKAKFFNDLDIAAKILQTRSPIKARDLGQQVKNYTSEWETIRVDVMQYGSFLKYTQHPKLLLKLLDTRGLTLVKASPSDYFWGVGLCENDPKIMDSFNYLGKNMLGICLMSVRDSLTSWLVKINENQSH